MKNHRWLPIAALTLLTNVLASPGYGQPTPSAATAPPARSSYRIDVKKSRFIVETQTSGLSAMFAHDHRMEIRDFDGRATFARGNSGAASLTLTVRAGSLYLLGENEIGARQSIESALREDVLETAKYPEIAFTSRSVKFERRGDGTYDVRLAGELALHGVGRPITVPARVSFEGGVLHAIGAFEIRQTDFKITPFSFVNGTVAIKDTVTISFDILATEGTK